MMILLHVPCDNGYNLVYVNDLFSKSFRSHLDKDAVYNFINTILEESKYCSKVTKKYFHK